MVVRKKVDSTIYASTGYHVKLKMLAGMSPPTYSPNQTIFLLYPIIFVNSFPFRPLKYNLETTKYIFCDYFVFNIINRG